MRRARARTSRRALTEQRWRDLQEVNSLVNRIVSPATDLEYYHRDEVWTLPDTYGDCEDYVLLKRKWLVERGWSDRRRFSSPSSSTRSATATRCCSRAPRRGDFVLDNKTDKLRRWYDTAYHFVKRQSVSDPNRWVSVGDPRWTAQSTAASR